MARSWYARWLLGAGLLLVACGSEDGTKVTFGVDGGDQDGAAPFGGSAGVGATAGVGGTSTAGQGGTAGSGAGAGGTGGSAAAGGIGGAGGTGGTGGTGGVVNPGAPGSGLVASGRYMSSSNYRLFISSQKPGGTGVCSSPNYRLNGGLVGSVH